jgi:signal transduction histidine kinase/PAS domain-containing protein
VKRESSRRVERQIARLTVLRARLFLRVLVVAVAVLAIGDFVLRSEHEPALLAVKVSLEGGLLAALSALRRRPNRRWAAALALAAIAATTAATVLSGWIANDPTAPPLTIGGMVLLSAVLVPWGLALQLVATGIALVGLLANLTVAAGPLGYSSLAACFSSVLGSIVAYGLDRQRRRSLEATRRRAASAATLRALVQNAPDSVLIVDGSGRVSFSNRRWQPHAVVDPVGRLLFEFAEQSEHRRIRRALAAVIAGGEPVSFEIATRLAKDEEVRLYRCRMASLRRPGEPPAAIVVATDVTAERRAEAERQESREIAAALNGVGRRLLSSLAGPGLVEELRVAAAAAVACDRCQVVSVESGWERRHPSPAFTELLAGEAIELAGDEVAGFAAEAGFELEQESQRLLAVLLRLGDEVLGLVVATRRSRDPGFTARDRQVFTGVAQLAALALRTAALVRELREANTVNSYFAATMSHEIRNMLASVVGYAQIVLEDTPAGDPLTADGVAFVERIRDRGQEALGVIASALEVSRGEDGRRSSAGREDVDPRRLFAELVQEMEDLRRGSCPDLVWTVEDGVGLLRSDRVKLRMVLKNLMTNALKFTREGEVRLTARREGERVLLSVTDTGVGIPSHQLPNLFKPFSQAHGRVSRDVGGTGLGLFIVQRLVEVLGGTIRVESSNRGTTFTITLPGANGPATTIEAS